MFDPEQIPRLREAIRNCASGDMRLLEELKNEVRLLKSNIRSIKERNATSISLVASDGGNNGLAYDPFFFQLVRVVDSNGKEECLDAVSPTSDTDIVSARQFDENGNPKTCLGFLMRDLNCKTLNQLSHYIPTGETIRNKPEEVPNGWVMDYRDLCEWAVLYHRICYTKFSTPTLIVRDGLLRSKKFRGELFIKMRDKINESIERIKKEDRIDVYLVGLAKHSKVLTKYNLVMALENIFPSGEARFARVPREIEKKAYKWGEYSRGIESEDEGGEAPKFNFGDMYFVRFGKMSGDPIWVVDIFSYQSQNDSLIFGCLLQDSINGFPVPYYPLCLQRAHENAQVVDFDFDILQDEIIKSIRDNLGGDQKETLDRQVFNFDKSNNRYS